MAPPPDRRSRKKAQTRKRIREAAERLFAERGFDAVTISDVAAAADVAVQTVFNHFGGKEELFFAGRTPWLDGLADAVRGRPAGVAPLTALRSYTTDLGRSALDESSTPERRAALATLEASPALQAALPAVLQRAEQRLAAALVEAWAPEGGGDDDTRDDARNDTRHDLRNDETEDDGAAGRSVRMGASLTAALWTAAARALLAELGAGPHEGADAVAARAAVEDLAKRTFDRLETDLAGLLDLPGA